MKIQDLSKELSHEDRAVRGGVGSVSNVGIIGGSEFLDNSGGNIGSSNTNLAIGTLSQANVAPETTTKDVLKTVNVLGSLGTFVGQ
jgi:hypothetical protein